MCDRAVGKIVQLIKMFDDQHGLRFFPRNMIEASPSPAVCACGAGLLREYTAAPPGAHKKRANAANGLNTCIDALRTIGTAWPCAIIRADDLQTKLRERMGGTFPIAQVDGPSVSTTDDLDLDDPNMDLSTEFYQYLHEWGQTPGQS
ncbi:hypothetical protein FRC09_008571 [Ceratobasidium sp. 395]|nr:hypothetical protein FRC09_008571 [Ceratobasidium sp. 395]